MEFSISFYGAAKNVTGSRYLLSARGKKILIDCGLYQERELKGRNWEEFPHPPDDIDAVVLTHAHLDHCGLLPKLVREGFNGPIYGTSATIDIAKIVMLDSAKINEEDAEFKRRRHEREGRKGPYPVVPLYTAEDAQAVTPLLQAWDFAKPLELGPGLSVEFIEVAHILGAAAVKFTIEDAKKTRTVLFSGDVGRWDMPILRDPAPVGAADYAVVESTYGNRIHGRAVDIPGELAEVINSTVKARGNIIIPSFAIERTQELLYFLAQLSRNNQIPRLRIFVDSPMAVRVSDVFKRHPGLFDHDTTELMRSFRLPGLTMVRTVAQSKAINRIRGSAIVIAGSGMCTGGRIKHHLVRNIGRPESTILFVGYQAVGTLGRIILDGEKDVRIQGETHRVRARIARISGFSAHADRDELTRWLQSLGNQPDQTFITHGEPEAAEAFSDHLQNNLGWQTTVPNYLDKAALM